ncbi:hypothetical protein J437_LFUL007301 [Ladona fulva]|uniref:Uncharacterized protein n=1 Tax=Ladona fulva TaxID=123851 RepID=A0A8K0PEB5_LADFU|nr:hypothetical protein J437_LFUL007301 [Ladona fulva]
MNASNGRSHDQMTRNIGPSARILQINVEDISRAKCDIIDRIAFLKDIDIICLQGTHIKLKEKAMDRLNINGFKFAAYTQSRSYGSAIFVKSTINNFSTKCALDYQQYGIETTWGYSSNGENGSELINWADNEKFQLTYEAKETSKITFGIQVPLFITSKQPRWNFRKANWDNIRQDVDVNLQYFQSCHSRELQKTLCCSLKSSQNANHRGYRKN